MDCSSSSSSLNVFEMIDPISHNGAANEPLSRPDYCIVRQDRNQEHHVNLESGVADLAINTGRSVDAGVG